MSIRLLPAGLLLLCAACVALAGFDPIDAQSKRGGESQKKAATKKKAEEKWLNAEAMTKKMKAMKVVWETLKVASKKQDGKKAASEADALRKMGPDMLKYDGKADVPDKSNKGGKVRDQKDYKEWVKKFVKGAKDFAKAARKGDWKAATKAQNAIRETCSDCHDSYQPLD